MDTTLTLETSHDRVTLRLCSPPGKPPTLASSLLDAIANAAEALAANPPSVVVIASSEPRYFCVGADIRVLETLTEATIADWVHRGHGALNRLADIPCPVVARVGGYAMGGGLELAMACDVIIAAEDAKLAQSEAALGFIPGWGGTLRLVERVGLAQAKRLFFTGATLLAREAIEIGLVDRVVPTDTLDAEVDAFVAAVGRNNPHALRTFKQIVDRRLDTDRDRAGSAEAEFSPGCCADPDARARLLTFLDRSLRKKPTASLPSSS